MADAAVTAAQVAKVAANSQVITGTSGAAHNAGDILYQNNDANQYWFTASTSNALTAGSQNGLAFSSQGASGAGQPITLQRTGSIGLGTASILAGEHYVLSVNAGKIGVTRDRLIGQFDSYVGYALDTVNLQLPASGPVAKSVARTVNG